MRGTTTTLAAAALALVGCAATNSEGPAQMPPTGECNAEPAQAMVGARATAEEGQRSLALTGARILRWAPPDSALTMDFRPDRLTVSYDRSMRIERIGCG